MIDYQKMQEGSAKQNEKRRMDTLLDEIIDAYARAVARDSDGGTNETLTSRGSDIFIAKYRNNGSIAGLQKLIDKYKVR